MATDAQRSSAPLAVAREWFETQYELARSLGRWPEARLIALRICETVEKEDFHEAFTLSSPLTVVSEESDA